MIDSNNNILSLGVRQSAEVENYMTSVERILDYSKIEPEGALESNYQFPKRWPQNGALSFQNVSLTYDSTKDPVLRNLNFDIKGGEKIGIVGRTGEYSLQWLFDVIVT